MDEGLGVGGACTGVTAGGCERSGVVSCLPFGGTACDLLPGPAEACNGLDDDCDGLVDEGSPGAGGACDAGGVGACSAGRFVCAEGALGCVADLTPGQQAETCNGLDDDCDGEVDEGELGLALTAACYFGPPGTVDAGGAVGEAPQVAGRLVGAGGGGLVRFGLEWHNGGRLWIGPFALLTQVDDPFSGAGSGRSLWVAGVAGRARQPVVGPWAIEAEAGLGPARWADVGHGALWGFAWRFAGAVSVEAQPDLDLFASLGWLGAEAGNEGGLFRDEYERTQLLAMGGYVFSVGVRLR